MMSDMIYDPDPEQAARIKAKLRWFPAHWDEDDLMDARLRGEDPTHWSYVPPANRDDGVECFRD